VPSKEQFSRINPLVLLPHAIWEIPYLSRTK
jgi:hypothetical protein